MKRPLAFFGFTLFSVLLCLNYFGGTALSVSLLIGAGVFFIISLSLKKLRQTLFLPTVLSAVIVSCLLFLCFETNYETTVSLCGENVAVEGEIAESPYFSRKNERYYCVIKVKSVGTEKVNTKMRLSFSESVDGIDHDDFEIGDRVSFTATVYPTGAYNGTASYFKSQNTYLGAYAIKSLVITESKYRPPGYYIDALRDSVIGNLLHDFDNDVASLLIAVITGDKSFMDYSTYNSFKEAGVVHIMAVSGLHLTVWVTFLALFIDFKGRKGKLMAALMIAFTVFMMNFASFTGSVKRAAMMTVLFFIGKIFGKSADSLNSLGFAAICVLLINPFAVSDISFLLSFLATMGIIVMGAPLGERIMKAFGTKREKLRKILSPFVLCFCISLSVSIFTMPVSLYYFGGISFAAPLTNLLFLFAVTPLIVLTGLYSFLRFVPFVSALAAVVLKYLALYMLKTAEFVSSFDWAYLYTDSRELKFCLMAACILALLTVILHKYSRVLTKITAIAAAGIFMLSIGFNYYTAFDRCKVTVYGSDEGSCAVVSVNGRGVLLGFDGNSYSEDALCEDIASLNIKTDAAIFFSEALTSEQKRICHSLGTENILTADGTSVTLFDKVTVTKSGMAVNIKTSDAKTYIFYKEPLQEEDSYGIIKDNGVPIYGDYENNFALTVGEKNPFTVTVYGNDIEVRGESSWLNLMKKVLKVT